MKRATLPQIQQSRLKIINDGDVPSPAAVARELGRTFSPASIVIGLRQIESREIRRLYHAERIQRITEAEGGSSNQILRDRLSKSEKLVANLKVRVDILERRERNLNRGYLKAERKLAKSRYRNRDYRDAMSNLAAEIITLEAALRKTGESWQPEQLSIPAFARARLQDANKARLIALRYSSKNGTGPIASSAEQLESINEPVDSLCSRLLSALSMREGHQNLIYNALHSYDSENRRLLNNVKSLEQRIMVLNQNQRRTSEAFSHLWPEELIKST
jgi:chromosome segregation ATPase